MLKSILKISLRSFLKNKTFSLINVFDLAIGIASCAVIFRYMYDEMTFDRYHDNAERISRFEMNNWACTSVAVAPNFKSRFPEIEKFVRFRPIPRMVVENGYDRFIEKGGFYADSSVFDVFSFPWLSGNMRTALTEVNSVVLTKSFAEK